MKILAIDSSSVTRSVALYDGGGAGQITDGILATAEAASNRGGRLASLVDQVLGEAGMDRSEVDEIAVGVGPGSAAGIRSTLSFALGWEAARGIRVRGISSVWSIAAEAQAVGIEGRFGVVIRGPMGKIYVSEFLNSGCVPEEVVPIRLCECRAFIESWGSNRPLLGPDLESLLGEGMKEGDGEGVRPRLVSILPTARGVGRVASAQVTGAECPLEPCSLVTPQFVKAPLPREIPEVS